MLVSVTTKSMQLPQPTYVPRLVIHKNRNVSNGIDHFENIELKWKLNEEKEEKKDAKVTKPRVYFTLAFDKRYEKDVLETYLPYAIIRFEEIQKEEKEKKLTIKLYSGDYGRVGPGGEWASINLEHPATFKKLAMDPGQKRSLHLKGYLNV
ncbi:hypothetical protein SO802_029528 [Lithocarpus litseifolius]|uniref:Uncharacterized protein n=1 Tax=Lithocarpus litseifolius TaxID=425828 RepID=A0AAW2BTM8_9ROSI